MEYVNPSGVRVCNLKVGFADILNTTMMLR